MLHRLCRACLVRCGARRRIVGLRSGRNRRLSGRMLFVALGRSQRRGRRAYDKGRTHRGNDQLGNHRASPVCEVAEHLLNFISTTRTLKQTYSATPAIQLLDNDMFAN